VLTTLRILENKGYVLHQKGGRAFVYKPKIERDEARDSALDDLLRRYFDNNAEALVAWLKKRSG
jgi:predicted transcriptional regulator